MGKTLRILSVSVLAGACSAETDGDLGQVAQPLVGAHDFEDCTTDEVTNLTNDIARLRGIGRSEAFLSCVMGAGLRGVTLPAWGAEQNTVHHLGPYIPCPTDTHSGETLERQVARFANITGSRVPTTHRCVAAHACGPDDQQACSRPSGVGENALIRWESVGTSNWYVMSHELTHAYDYWHHNCPTQSAQSVPHIVSKCMKEVQKQIDASPVCAAVQAQCEGDEIAVPRHYGEFGADASCVCSPNVWPDENEAGDRFGASFAVGDFDRDFFPDLAVGAPGENRNRGVVYIFRNSPVGLRFWKRIGQSQITAIAFPDGTGTFVPGNTTGDEFGYALGAGDLNGDGFDDLLVGTPGEQASAGTVFMLPGSSLGPDMAHAQYIDQRESGGEFEAGDRFGETIVVGNFNGDALLDFAIGAPREAASGADTGSVSVHRGRAGTPGVSSFESSDTTMTGCCGGDFFGTALAAGNIDGVGNADLIVGAPGRSAGNGAAYVWTRSGSWTLTQTLSRPATGFGSVLAVGDFISTSAEDLAVGAPNDAADKGAVFTFRGSSGGLVFAQTLRGNETDQLGAALRVGYVVGDATSSGKGDLLIALMGEAYGSGEREGNVSVYAGVTGSTLGAEALTLDQYAFNLGSDGDPLMQPEAHGRDRFGGALAVIPSPLRRIFGQFVDEVAVGALSDTVDGASSGSVFMFFDGIADRKIDQVTMSHEYAR